MDLPIIIAIVRPDDDCVVEVDKDDCIVDDAEYGKLLYKAYVPKKYTPPPSYYDTDEYGDNNYEFTEDPQGSACYKRICDELDNDELCKCETLHMEYYGHHEVGCNEVGKEVDKYVWIIMGPSYDDILEICVTEDDMKRFIETPYRRQRQIYRIRYREI
jgi:hypothetical protein